MSAQQAVISTPLHGHFIFSSGRVGTYGDHDFFLTFETLLFAGCALHVPNFAGGLPVRRFLRFEYRIFCRLLTF